MTSESESLETRGSDSRRYRLYLGYEDTWLEERNQVDGVDLPPMIMKARVDESVQELELYWRIPVAHRVGRRSQRCAKCLCWDPQIRRKRCVVYLETYVRSDPSTWLDDDDYLILGKLAVFEEVIFRVVDGVGSPSGTSDIIDVKGVPLDGTKEEEIAWKVMQARRESVLLQTVQGRIHLFLPEWRGHLKTVEGGELQLEMKNNWINK